LNNQKNMTEEIVTEAVKMKEDLAVLLNTASTDRDMITEESMQQQSTLCNLLTSDPSQTSRSLLSSAISYIQKVNTDLQQNFLFDTIRALSTCSSNIFKGLSVVRNDTIMSEIGPLYRKNFDVVENLSDNVLENIVRGTVLQILETDSFSAQCLSLSLLLLPVKQ